MTIAVIGGGISGLGTALALSERHDVRLFEADDRFGGHANTVEVPGARGETIPVDTGFIVFNTVNYPNLCGLFDHLGVASEESDMTFALSLDDGRLEYACDTINRVFAQRWRVADPRFLMAFGQILRFCRDAKADLESGALDDISLGEWLTARRFGPWVRKNFIWAMGGAIWSTPLEAMERFPARAFVQFFKNHELLTSFERKIQWRTVSGGSREYVRRAAMRLGPRAACGVGAARVARRPDGRVSVAFTDGSEGVFEAVVLAVHSDQALALMADADAEERSLLGAVGYAPNTAVLHGDPALMPKRRRVWSSWNVLGETGAEARPPAVSYWMNRLQNIDMATPLFVTLNPPAPPKPELTYGTFSYAHPQFNGAAFQAQAGFDSVQGRGGVWHAGAWLGWGFHEDGLKSGLRVAAALGAEPSWARELGEPILAAEKLAAE